MSEKHATDGYYKPYHGPAGGWGALISTQHHWLQSKNATRNLRTLLKTNQSHGFDCPGWLGANNINRAWYVFARTALKL